MVAVAVRSLLAMLALTALAAAGAEVFGCGGFVQMSESLKAGASRPDLTLISVKLVSADDVVVASGAAAPNGYFFMPLETATPGLYRVVADAPAGWSVVPAPGAPAAVAVAPSGESAGLMCNGGADYNLRFGGFALTGAVVGTAECDNGKRQGRGRVALTLTASSGAGAALRAESDASGAFAFAAVAPGSYVLTAARAGWTLALATVPVEMGSKPVDLGAAFVVTGYSVSGVVRAGADPVPGVTVFVFHAASATPVPVDCAAPGALPDGLAVPAGQRALCALTTDAAGAFTLAALPCGDYTAMPLHRASGAASFDVAPSSAAFHISADAVVVPPFTVAGFSLAGRVVGPAGRGMGGVAIHLDGAPKAVATTATDGSYVLALRTAGVVDVSASRAHCYFSSLSSLRVTPALARLPDISVTGFAVCGSVVLSGSEFSMADLRAVLSTDDGEVVESRRPEPRDGSFCFEAPSGLYKLAITVAPRDAARGLVIVPAERTFTVAAEPVLALEFSQARVAVTGRLACLAGSCALPDGSPVRMRLTPAGGSTNTPLSVAVSAKTGAYSFPDVPAGVWSLAAAAPAWCFEPAAATIEVGTADVAAPRIAQSGFKVSFVASHALSIGVATSADGAAAGSATELPALTLAAGPSSHCLPTPGRYVFTPPTDACFEFAAPGSLTLDTAAAAPAAPLVLQAGAVRLAGTVVLVADVVSGGPAAAPASIAIQATVGDRTVALTARPVSPSASAAGSTAAASGARVYAFSLFVAPGVSATFRPSADALLFRPAAVTATPTASVCAAPLEPLVAERGVFLSGSVTPPAAGTTIEVYETGSGDVAPVLTTLTDATGRFSAGPLFAGVDYRMAAVREGFVYKQVERGVFKAVKLGGLTVRVAAADGTPVDAVLLSLSGDEFRSNVATDASGVRVFAALMPGEYYLRPLLREHVFTPDAASLTVGEGANEQLSFVAKRTAFSIVGSVLSLAGLGERGLVVDGVADGSSDSTTTDATGAFRLRGFAPGASVRVTVRAPAGAPATVAPAERTLVMTAADATGVQFAASRPPPTLQLTGVVTASTPAALASLTVELVGADGALARSVPAAPLGYYRFDRLALASYTVRLRTTLSSRDYAYAPVSRALSPTAAGAFNSSLVGTRVVADLHFDAVHRGDAGEDSSLPSVILALLAVALALALHRTQLTQFWTDIQYVPSGSTGFEVAPARSSAKRSTSRK